MLANCAHAETQEPLNYLVLKGQDQGFLTQRQIFDTFPDIKDNSEQLEALYLALDEEGIRIAKSDNGTVEEGEEEQAAPQTHPGTPGFGGHDAQKDEYRTDEVEEFLLPRLH